MKTVLYIISILWIAFGSCAVLYTVQTRRWIRNILKGFDLKIIAAVPILTGLLLLFSASASHYPWFVRLIGLIAVVKGAFAVWNPNRMVDGVIEWYAGPASDQSHRFFGIVFIILGTAVLSWIV